jgi:hypothetical protein
MQRESEAPAKPAWRRPRRLPGGGNRHASLYREGMSACRGIHRLCGPYSVFV